MRSTNICWLCECPITGNNAAKEHIIPNAIGGRRTLENFLCNTCNSSSGEKWDAELANQLNYIGLLFETKRQRGVVPSMKTDTATGGLIEIQRGNKPVIGKPTCRVTSDRKGVHIEIKARTRREARKMIEGLKRKYPKIDIDKSLEAIQESETYSNVPAGITFYVGGPNAERSIVKSAVALACEAGLKPEDCDIAMKFLRNEDFEYKDDEYWHYYQKDLVKNREIGLPLHCVYVTASPSRGLLLAYLEYYGWVRRLLCLSKQYTCKPISRLYSINPVNGKELTNVLVDLDYSTIDVVKMQTNKELVTGLEKAINQIMGSGMRLSRCRAIAEISVECMKEYSEKNGLVMKKGDQQDLIEEVAQRLMPLIENYSTPMESPKDFDPIKEICRAIARVNVECMKEYSKKNGLVMKCGDQQDLVEEVTLRLIPLIEYYSTPMEFPEGFDPIKGI